MKSHYIIPIFVPHKGCPHDCIFCNQKRITGQINNVDSYYVEEEIDKYLKTVPNVNRTVELSFYGGSFTGLPIDDQVGLLKPAKSALDNGIVDAIRLSTRPDYINEYILNILGQYGVSIIELGVQSMDEEVLLLSNRGHTRNDVFRASELIKKHNITLGLQMMVGLPGSSQDKDLKTADEFIKIMPEMVRIYPALIIKDTYMEDMFKKGEFLPVTLEDAIDTCSKLYLKFQRLDINIIRIGLQPTENISLGKDVIAGPFHPAFRELVESKILNDIIKYLYKKQLCKSVHIHINERTMSKLYADKKKYYSKMLCKIGLDNIKIVRNNQVPINTILLYNDENSQTMSIKDYSLII